MITVARCGLPKAEMIQYIQGRICSKMLGKQSVNFPNEEQSANEIFIRGNMKPYFHFL